ncbi:hypothetical protein [Longimicrobium sp.]|uniref:hypothetical protein n=1 Tax=Longimicrobium sp. TaxID=2029185 RepID=UPI002E361993|nr:hypothetical protein [Longimicrobium sp.]HEX6040336.1 hypothetical protein [Longimicrobium sp.]
MISSTFVRAAALCAVLTLSVSTAAHAQLGGLRRAAGRAAGAVAGTPSVQAAPPAAAQPSTTAPVNRGDVLEMTAPVLDRFHAAMRAERADLGQLAQRLGGLKTPEQYAQCQLDFYNSEAGQAVYARLNAAAESNDYARMTAVAEEVKAALARACGDPEEGDRIRREAPEHALQAGLAAGGFSAREYALIKERVVPFCEASAAGAVQGEVRLPGDGINVFWVYTAAETAALRERCPTLLRELAEIS